MDKYPNFNRGRVLKKEMLESIKDYPRNIFRFYLKDVSDGIISGADVCVCEKQITITSGLLKYNSRIYLIEEDVVLDYSAPDKEAIIKIKFLDAVSDGDFTIYGTKIFIDTEFPLRSGELELARFNLKNGAQLRSDYTDFYDLGTEFNTLNIINVPFSGFEKTTINPFILKYFAKSALKNNPVNVYDVVFVMQCLGKEPVNRDIILQYISHRLNIELKEYSNTELFRYLCQILKELESGIIRKQDPKPKKALTIMVD